MKKVIFILMLIATTMAVKQSKAQAKAPIVRSPMIKPSMPVKPLAIVSRTATPPPRLISASHITSEYTEEDGIGTVTITETKTQSDSSVPAGWVLDLQKNREFYYTPTLKFIYFTIVKAN